MPIDRHPRTGSRVDAAHDFRAEVKRTAYVLARGGVVGMVSWIFRSELNAAAARYVTGPVAAALMGLSLVLFAIGNNLHIGALSSIAGMSLLVTPAVYLLGSIQRSKEAYWRAAHGRDSEAFRAEAEADERRAREAVGKEDWLVYPPWREHRSGDEAPRFGRRER